MSLSSLQGFNMTINNNKSADGIPQLINELQKNFDIIISNMKRSQSHTLFTHEQLGEHIEKTEALIKLLTNTFQEKNLLGLPTDFDIQSMASNLKKSNDVLKHSLSYATTSVGCISKAFVGDVQPVGNSNR